MKEISVAFISKELMEDFESLNSGKFENKRLYRNISNAIDTLKSNPESGIKIAKRLWPKEYAKKYGLTNLWKFDLPEAWRLTYTIEATDVKIVSIVLEWFDHKTYEKRFKY